MGYSSTAKYGSDLVARYVGPESNLSDEQIELIKKVEATGLKVQDIERVDHAKVVDKFLRSLNDDYATNYWLIVDRDAEGEPGEVFFLEDGDSFRAYSFERTLSTVIQRLKEINYELEGTIYISGEDQGDVVRYRIRNGRIEVAKAVLAFPDGEVWTRG